ncbi:MAG TPA: hypothetical protein VH351_23115 [Bryobacteraceae bacterium]|jgi:hypothetical protein|nr:hypothetical protein [Bryobacteraceae bacterium]
MDKERIMQDSDAFLKAYQVLQSLEETEKKKDFRPRSFAFGLRTSILRLSNLIFRGLQHGFATIYRGTAASFAFTVLCIGGVRTFFLAFWRSTFRGVQFGFGKMCVGIAALFASAVLHIHVRTLVLGLRDSTFRVLHLGFAKIRRGIAALFASTVLHIDPRTLILGLRNSTSRPGQLRFAKVCGVIAAVAAFTLLGVGLLHHFVSEGQQQQKSAAIAAYAPVSHKESAVAKRDNVAGAGTANSVIASKVSASAVASQPGTSEGLHNDQRASTGAPDNMSAPEPSDADLDSSPMVSQWKLAQQSGKLLDFQAFIHKYPTGPYSSEAADAIQRLQWEAVDKQNANSLRAYLDKNQQGPYSAVALQQLGALLQAQQDQQARAAEQNAWDSVDLRSAEGIERYLAQYPKGNHVAVAQELLHRLTQEKKAWESAHADENAWNAVAARDEHSLEQYLDRFPSGTHSDQARQLLNEMWRTVTGDRQTTAQEANAVVATLKRYSDAWNAKDLNNITALQPGIGRQTAKDELSSTRSIVMQIHPTSLPKIQGDRATVECIRKVEKVFADGAEIQTPGVRMTYVLVKRGGTWLIADSR